MHAVVALPDGTPLTGAELDQAREAWSAVVAAHQRRWESALGRELTAGEINAFGDVGGPAWRFYTAAQPRPW
jgi:hypothetical protein